MRRSSSSVSWKRRERVALRHDHHHYHHHNPNDCAFIKPKSFYSFRLSSSISPPQVLLQSKMLLFSVLLVTTCYGLEVNASHQIENANMLPPQASVKSTAVNLIQNEAGAETETGTLDAQLKRFRRSGQRFKSDLELTGASTSGERTEGRSGQLLQAGELNLDRSLAGRPNTNTASIRNVTAQNGQSVILHCPVEPSAEGTSVSWFRGTGELQLLSYETDTIIHDERFVVRHIVQAGNEHDWALQIKSLDKSTDSGLYQCQTNSDPPQSQYYQLNVVEPQVHILGAPDMAVKLGSAINLTCVISQSPDQLQFVFWYRDQRMINYDINERGKIVMSKLANKPDTIISNLQILNSRLADSGNYTCMPSGARPMAIQVHVVEGSDKRLIMFQNDYDPTSAVSAQQTNSALSVHVVRISRTRIYAFFLAFLIFSSWFQLVAQTQTAISLVLLAIIGFLLGRATDDCGSPDTHEASRKHLEADQVDPSKANGSGGGGASKQQRRRQARNAKRNAASTCSSPRSADSSATDSCEPKSCDDSTNTMDPLIKRANSALDMLKTLNSASSEEEDEEEEEEEEMEEILQVNDAPSGETGALIVRSNKSIKKATIKSERLSKQPMKIEKALTSPSALSSTSSSTGSTGYNSDTRSTNLTRSSPTPLRVVSSPLAGRTGSLLENCDQEEEMIELVRQPTALRLVMDEFSARSSSSCSQPDRCAGVEQVTSGRQPSGLRTTGSLSGGANADEEEPHYSSPALTFVQRPSSKPVVGKPPEAAHGATCEPP